MGATFPFHGPEAEARAALRPGLRLTSDLASNPKTLKLLDELGIEGIGLSLAPADEVAPYLGRGVTVCPFARANECDRVCLAFGGRGALGTETDPWNHAIHRARIRRTLAYFVLRHEFMARLRHELRLLVKRARKKGRRAVARLDVLSDLGLAERLAPEFPEVTFYDYTKVAARVRRWLRGGPANYHLTFSRGSANGAEARALAEAGANVAVVFRDELPERWYGRPVVWGDEHDFRFLDPRGVVVGLVAKGLARHDESGFVVDPAAEAGGALELLAA